MVVLQVKMPFFEGAQVFHKVITLTYRQETLAVILFGYTNNKFAKVLPAVPII